MNVDLKYLRSFLLTAQNSSFSGASRDLKISQAAVSKQIQLLERQFQVIFFVRARSGVELTTAGKIFAEYAQRVLDLTRDVRQDLHSDQPELKSLRIGTSPLPGHYLLAKVIDKFQKNYPGIDIELKVGNSVDIARRLQNSELDLGFVDLQVDAPGLQYEPFIQDEITLCVPPGHKFRNKRAVSIEMLADEVLVMDEPGSSIRQIVEDHLENWGVRPKRIVELPGYEAVKLAVVAGLGVTFLPRHAVTLELSNGLLHVPKTKDLTILRTLYRLTHNGSPLSESSQKFLKVLSELA